MLRRYILVLNGDFEPVDIILLDVSLFFCACVSIGLREGKTGQG